jgi:GntR family transcriptional regulator
VERRAVAYRELADAVRTAVQSGEYADGAPLPTELALAQAHGVSRQTVRRAMQELVAGGLIYRVAGRGTFAIDQQHPYVRSIGSITDLMGLSSDTELHVVEPLRRTQAPVEARRLGVDGEKVSVVTFTRHHGGAVFSYTTVFLPSPVARLLAGVRSLRRTGAHSPDTVIGLLDRRLAHPIVRAEQTITAVRTTAALAAQLGATRSSPLLKVDRLYRDEQGGAVELAVSHFLPEHYEYRVTLRRDPR